MLEHIMLSQSFTLERFILTRSGFLPPPIAESQTHKTHNTSVHIGGGEGGAGGWHTLKLLQSLNFLPLCLQQGWSSPFAPWGDRDTLKAYFILNIKG